MVNKLINWLIHSCSAKLCKVSQVVTMKTSHSRFSPRSSIDSTSSSLTGHRNMSKVVTNWTSHILSLVHFIRTRPVYIRSLPSRISLLNKRSLPITTWPLIHVRSLNVFSRPALNTSMPLLVASVTIDIKSCRLISFIIIRPITIKRTRSTSTNISSMTWLMTIKSYWFVGFLTGVLHCLRCRFAFMHDVLSTKRLSFFKGSVSQAMCISILPLWLDLFIKHSRAIVVSS